MKLLILLVSAYLIGDRILKNLIQSKFDLEYLKFRSPP